MDSVVKGKTYKSPRRKLVRLFEKSREQWKLKHHQAKADVKRLSSRIRFLEKSKGQWKSRVEELEAEVVRLKAKEQVLEQELESIEKKEALKR
jgi:chromosome segregation ATPase